MHTLTNERLQRLGHIPVRMSQRTCGLRPASATARVILKLGMVRGGGREGSPGIHAAFRIWTVTRGQMKGYGGEHPGYELPFDLLTTLNQIAPLLVCQVHSGGGSELNSSL